MRGYVVKENYERAINSFLFLKLCRGSKGRQERKRTLFHGQMAPN
jgi:hypothetical protein